MKFPPSPVVPFRHHQRLTDTAGVVARADGIMPRHGDGYRVDDAARGLAVTCRESSPSAELITLGRRYLHFLAQAQAADGKFRGQLGGDRRWRGRAEARDAWGRSLRALGTAAARGPAAGIREQARARFDASAVAGSPYPHSMAFAALGAAEVTGRRPGHPGALSLLAIVGTVIGEPAADAGWPWPAARLSYANAAIAEAVIVAGHELGRGHLLRDGRARVQTAQATGQRPGSWRWLPVMHPAAEARTGGARMSHPRPVVRFQV
ncbi:MAG TPA: hypothetical protein VFV73_44360, partial [Streptosporangiaceae bacterium]|nr:hypothetical protein [Streptosporangiaceae bacterium]